MSRSHAIEWIGQPGDCDVCGRPLLDERSFCDAELPAHGGRWGILCSVCVVTEGLRPGWGHAQVYERVDLPEGGSSTGARWRCIAGAEPLTRLLD